LDAGVAFGAWTGFGAGAAASLGGTGADFGAVVGFGAGAGLAFFAAGAGFSAGFEAFLAEAGFCFLAMIGK